MHILKDTAQYKKQQHKQKRKCTYFIYMKMSPIQSDLSDGHQKSGSKGGGVV